MVVSEVLLLENGVVVVRRLIVLIFNDDPLPAKRVQIHVSNCKQEKENFPVSILSSSKYAQRCSLLSLPLKNSCVVLAVLLLDKVLLHSLDSTTYYLDGYTNQLFCFVLYQKDTSSNTMYVNDLLLLPFVV